MYKTIKQEISPSLDNNTNFVNEKFDVKYLFATYFTMCIFGIRQTVAPDFKNFKNV